MSAQLTITALAGMGDGVGHLADGRAVFVPLTLAGDVVEIELDAQHSNPQRGRLLRVITPSPERAIPPCPHFGVCGGCQLQHLAAKPYQDFKRNRLLDVMRQLKLDDSVVEPLVTVPQQSRRRAELSVTASKDGSIALGFTEARSHRTVNVETCFVVLPQITALLDPLRALIASLKKPGVVDRIHLTVADNHAVDVVFQVKSRPANADLALLKSANLPGVARLGLQHENTLETLLQHQPLTLTIGGMAVTLPAGTFLQATAESQQAMSALVSQRARNASRVMDLYSGCGTYSLPLLAAGKIVHAVEGSQEMVAALHNAARKTAPERIHSSVRDLYKDPVKTEELNRFDCVVINPPRNGALPQCEAIAKSTVPLVIMVSCNPATFARDAAALIKGGYRLESATPIDQFLWSHHLELIAKFTR